MGKTINRKMPARWRRWKAQNEQCFYCHRTIRYAEATDDHKKPKSRGGKGSGNLVVACGRCNTLKANRGVNEFVNGRRL